MKRTAAILLLLLLVFNLTGYRFTVQWMQQNQNTGLEKQLDANDYDEASLIELSVPLSLPYYNNWPEFERFNGEVEVNGITYKYVKRKVQDGKLIVKCLPNPQQQVIQKNVSELFAQANGLPQNESGFKKIIKAGLFEYEETKRYELITITSVQTRCFFLYPVNVLLHQAHSLPWQPPEIAVNYILFL